MEEISPRVRKQRLARRRALKRVVFLCFIVLMLGLTMAGLMRWGRGFLVTKSAKTAIINTGVLEMTLPVKAMILCNEAVITAHTGGIFYAKVPEGQRIRKGEVLGKITGSALTLPQTESAIVSPYTGLVSYRFDGWEGLLTEEKFLSWNWNELECDANETRLLQTGKWVEPGESVARVVNNFANTRLGISIPISQLPPGYNLKTFETGRLFGFRFPNSGKNETIKLKTAVADASQVKIVVECNDFKEELLPERKISGEFVLQTWTGAIIQETFLVYREEVPGLYILRKGWVEWKPVEVEGGMGKQIVVKGLKEGEVIITNPNRVQEGLRLY